MADPAFDGAIDFDHINLFTGGDVAITREVLRLFRTQTAQLIVLLRETADRQTYKETAHGLKGAMRAVGAWDAAKRAEEAERLIDLAPEDRAGAIAALESAIAKAHALALAYEEGRDFAQAAGM
jgi:HPt (histidine-containing phosphotransfer) domain-containing protein